MIIYGSIQELIEESFDLGFCKKTACSEISQLAITNATKAEAVVRELGFEPVNVRALDQGGISFEVEADVDSGVDYIVDLFSDGLIMLFISYNDIIGSYGIHFNCIEDFDLGIRECIENYRNH